MIAQTVLPAKWVIVDDGSTDKNTGNSVPLSFHIIPWIEMVQMPQRRDRSFAGKVQAFNAGFEKVKDIRYDIVGNLDGDISFEKDHLAFLSSESFQKIPRLGVAGTVFREERLRFRKG